MSRKGTIGRMAIIAGTPDGGVGRNRMLTVATTAATKTATTGKVVMIDRTTTGTAVVDLITFATHSEHFSGRLREQRSWNRNKQN